MVQHIKLTVEPGPHQPVVVKAATDAEGAETLTREAARLRRARHPGVVEAVGTAEGRLELSWVGSHTLETAHLSVSAAAGVLASVAVTVADLHGLGVVHGRIDPSHVVLAADGRPVLCGMRGPAPGEPEPGPADDVAAVGRLIDHLLGPEAEPEPIPDRRWARRPWSGYHRRTLQLLADRASHDDPARRPTARALANAIAEAVPDARLVARPDATDPTRSTTTDPNKASAPTVTPVTAGPARVIDVSSGDPAAPSDRGGVEPQRAPGKLAQGRRVALPNSSSFEPESPQDHHAGAEAVTARSGPRWPTPLPLDLDAEAVGPDPLRAGPFIEGLIPRDHPASATPSGALTVPRPEASSPPLGRGISSTSPEDDTPPSNATGVAPTGEAPGLTTGSQPNLHPSGAADRVGRAHPTTSPTSSTILGLRLEPPTQEPDPVRPTPPGRRPPPGRSRHTGRTRPFALSAAALVVVSLAVGRIWTGSQATAGTRPPAGEATTRPAAPATVVEPVPVVRSETTRPPTDSDRFPDAQATVNSSTAGPTRPSSPTTPTAAPPTDPEAGEVAGEVVTWAGARFGVGRHHDVVTVGDWDCDGTATPGVVRPATGDVFLFDRWASPGQPVTVAAALRVEGARLLIAPSADCRTRLVVAGDGEVVVRRSTGGWTIEATGP